MPSKKSRLQLYADECFPVTSVTFLKSLGFSINHAFDLKLIQKSDRVHLQESKKLKRVLITLDRDFLYYNKINLDMHPGVIVISTGSNTPGHINCICEKALKQIDPHYCQNSLVKITFNKITRSKLGKIISSKNL